MKVIVGTIMGFFSGFLIYMGSAMLFLNGKPSGIFVFVTFIGGWVLSSIILIRGARTVSKVISRGFLLGAAEWLCMIPVSMVLSGKTLTEIVAQGTDTGAEMAGATIGAGIASFITGGVSIAMALACIIGFAISHFIGREMKPEAPTPKRTCPECAELIQAAARKCKHCGAEIPQTEIKTERTSQKPPSKGKKRWRFLRYGCLTFVIIASAFIVGIFLQMEKTEDPKNPKNYYRQNEDDIIDYIEALIAVYEFDLAQEELSKYENIPEAREGVDVLKQRLKITRALSEVKSQLHKRPLRSSIDKLTICELSELKEYSHIFKKLLSENQLTEKLKNVPSKNSKENYNMYYILSLIKPENESYKKKIEYYGKEYKKDEYLKAKRYFKMNNPRYGDLLDALKSIDTAIQLNDKYIKEYGNLKRKLEKVKLRFYEGNDIVEMAVLERSPGNLHVWIKNNSSEVFHVNPNHFTLIGKDNRSYHYKDSSEGLLVDLQPGTETQGSLEFDTYSEARELVFDSLSTGRISRVFP